MLLVLSILVVWRILRGKITGEPLEVPGIMIAIHIVAWFWVPALMLLIGFIRKIINSQ